MKLIKYLKSWKRINLNKDFSCIIFGPQASNQRIYFENNYCYIDPLNCNVYNFKLVPYGLYKFFLNFIKNPGIFIKLIKFWPTIFFTCALIEKKRIKNIISLVDYNPWPIYIKKILKDKVYSITVQNSARHYPLDRMKNLNQFDEYFLWNCLSDEELSRYSHKTKLIKFGSLKSLYNINKNNKWKTIKENPKKVDSQVSIFLISTYSSFHDRYLKKNFHNLDSEQFFHQSQIMKEKNNDLMELQCLEYINLCIYLKNFLRGKDINFKILRRIEPYEKKLSEGEIFFFNKIFSNPKIIDKNSNGRFEEILENKNSVYITNISNLGRECFAINLKTLFFSQYGYKFNPNFFEKNNIFYSIEENQDEFSKRLNSIINMSPDDYSINKKLVKETALCCEPLQENFKYFLKTTGLKLSRI